ncbi:MAG: glycosyltransferase family 4 protein [Alphaproteobacteria bacterium]|nr:glycosyltransferase family 4 protein [Alphaproteobacteria bacterium]
MKSQRIWVFHPGSASSISELVAALVVLGHRVRFFTGVFGMPRWVRLLVRLLPARLGQKLRREFGRREFPPIPREAVVAMPGWELVFVLASRLLRGWTSGLARLLHWRNRRLEARFAATVRLTRPAVRPALIIAQDTSAWVPFKAGRAVGAVTVLNQMIGHLAVAAPILAAEAGAWPDWADSLHAAPPAWLVEQCRAEVALADYSLAPSPFVLDSLVAVGARRESVFLLPYGVNPGRFRPAAAGLLSGADRPARFRILFVGQISQRKGLAYLLEAVRLLDDPEIELVFLGNIVGRGVGFQRQAARLGNRLVHLGNRPHSEIAEVFQSADIFVYPSLFEGSALAIYEAMASALPVITTVNSGSLVRHEQEGLLVPIRDVPALTRAILRLKQDQPLRLAMGKAGRQRAIEYSWDRYQENLNAILGKVHLE